MDSFSLFLSSQWLLFEVYMHQVFCRHLQMHISLYVLYVRRLMKIINIQKINVSSLLDSGICLVKYLPFVSGESKQHSAPHVSAPNDILPQFLKRTYIWNDYLYFLGDGGSSTLFLKISVH